MGHKTVTDLKTNNHKSQENHKTDSPIAALSAVLSGAGIDASDLQIALQAISDAKERRESADTNEAKYHLNKTLVYEDVDAFIYQRATSKSGRWYFRIYDEKRKKPVIKSLKTSDKVQALANARLQYVDIKGKIERGERLKSLSPIELLTLWDEKLKGQITDIPHQGLTPDSYKQKRYFLGNFEQYVRHLGLQNTAIDKIDIERFRDFGDWLKNKPKETALWKKGRCLDLVNNNISEIIRMYHQLGVRERFISATQVPNIDRVKVQLDDSFKRDILNEEQYERFWKHLQYRYITIKHNPRLNNSKGLREIEVRKIWKEFILIMSNVGFRSKELLGIKMKEIMENPNWDEERRSTDVLMKVRKENSKTGRSRICVAPVKKRIQRIIDAYQVLGITLEPDDYLFLNPKSKTRLHFGRTGFYQRLKDTLIESGLQNELDKEEKSITLYSFRHQYACWRLRYGDVPIHLLAKQMGTSIQKIESTYGHIQVEQQAEIITKSQSHIVNAGFVLSKPEVIEEEEEKYISKDSLSSAKYDVTVQKRSNKTKVTA
jgi:integrase